MFLHSHINKVLVSQQTNKQTRKTLRIDHILPHLHTKKFEMFISLLSCSTKTKMGKNTSSKSQRTRFTLAWPFVISDIIPVWVRSDFGKCQRLNWLEADTFCKSHGGRLCSKEEISEGCGAQSDCGFDSEEVWTKTRARKPRNSCHASQLVLVTFNSFYFYIGEDALV